MFYRGYDLYDPIDAGFVSQKEQADRLGAPWDEVTRIGSEYDVHWRSNSNQGHESGVTLPQADKDALIEYLKAL